MAQRHVFVLTEAQKFVNEKDCQFICHALNKLMKKLYFSIYIDACAEIKQYIERSIAPNLTVGEWLQEQGCDYKFSDHPESIEYRRRWIQHMIDNHEEFFGKD
jgi:hypothetical protein